MGRKRNAEPATLTEAVGYLRVSTTEQADSGLSLSAQRARVVAYCEANGWRLAAVHEDAGVSGKTLARPGLGDALGDLRPGRVLVALKLDRLTRSVRDLYDLTETIQQAGAEWATVIDKYDTTTATGRLMLRLIAELSEWDREVIGERTAAALGEKRVRRERLGTTPLGYTTVRTADGVTLAQHAEEQGTVLLARELRRQGQTLQAIADALTEAAHPTKRGGQWHPKTVSNILRTRYIETIQETETEATVTT